MKIIQIIPFFGLGGAEIMCENLTYELCKLGNDVIVISLHDYRSAITERMENAGIDVRYLGKKLGLDFSLFKKLRKLFIEEKPDVIHTHLYTLKYAVFASTGIKCKRIHTVHSVAEKENNLIERKLNKLFFKFEKVVPVALSEIVRTSIEQEYKIEKSKIPVIINGIDLSKCKVKEDYVVNGNFKILHIGRFFEPKNHIGLIKAFELFFQKYPNSVLQLIGDGETRKCIEEYVKEHSLTDSVEFLGLQSDVYSFLHDADIFTLPSLYEGIPMALIEAMGTGLPIVATAVGGVPDMLKDGENAILTALNIEEISRAFLTYALDEKLRKMHGKKAKERSVLFSAHSMAKSYLEIYRI